MTQPPTIISDLPELPGFYAWHIIEAHHHKGVTFWLKLDYDNSDHVRQYGWRTGYTPTRQQIIDRAHKMLGEVKGRNRLK